MTSKEHYAISSRCVDAMDGYYDQHVYDAMMYHDGAGTLALMAEKRAARAAARAKPAPTTTAHPRVAGPLSWCWTKPPVGTSGATRVS